jgi:hypothetical protein
MAVFNGMFPVLPGKEDQARAFAKAVTGAKSAEFDKIQADAGTERETWTLQTTPQGSFVIVWFEGDVDAAFGNMATKDDEAHTWFRQQVLEITGVDMTAPDDSPQPEVLVDWSR